MLRHMPLTVNALVCLLSLTFLAETMWDGLTFPSFFDEATHILGGKMLDSGAILYRTFIDSHGPFIFFLTQIYGLVAGWSNPNTARFINLLFMAGSIVSVVTSPSLNGTMPRIWAVTVLAGLMATVWLHQGLFMVSFYPVAGALAGISLSSIVLPASLNITPSRGHGLIAGFALAMLVATAYSFAPTVLLFTVVVIWNSYTSKHWRSLAWFLSGEIVGFACAVLYLYEFADFRGYFAFHLAENQFIYANYIHFSAHSFIQSLELSAVPDDNVQSLAVCCLAGSMAILGGLAVLRKQLSRLPSLFGILLGSLALNARGATGFQNGTFVYAVIVLAAISVASLLETIPCRFSVGVALFNSLLIVGMAGVMRPALYVSFGLTAAQIHRTSRWPIGAKSNGRSSSTSGRSQDRTSAFLPWFISPTFISLPTDCRLMGSMPIFPGMRTMPRHPGLIAHATCA